ncbi:hypothetical protein [Lentzea sp. NPDC055074]
MDVYSRQAQRLWRWVDAPQDVEVAGFVALQSVLDGDERARLRADLSDSDQHTLITFARRIALATLRTGDPAALVAAVESLAAIDGERVDERDLAEAAALVVHAAQRAGAELSAAGADPAVAEILLDLAAGEVDLPGDWGLREVTTPDGVVLLQDDGEDYPPESDLAGRALRAAALLEAEGYPHAEVTVGTELPAVWLGEEHEELLRSLGPVASVQAEPEPAADGRTVHFALVFLAEAATAGDAAAIASAAGEVTGGSTARLGVAAGHRCAVLVARPSLEGATPVETAASLERFRPGLTDLLR